MSNEWTYVLDILLLSLFLGIATYIKRTFRFFQKYLVPNSIIAGFIGLIAGPSILNLVRFDTQRLENLIYHLMAVGFIALALKERNREKNRDITNSGIFIVSTYLVQGILGFALTLFMVNSLYPDLFPAFGLLLPLGFGQGPGQAVSIGKQWQELGFSHGANIGLSIAAIGFIWACLGGIPLVNYLMKKKKMQPDRSGIHPHRERLHEEDNPDDSPLSESIDRISIQLFLIGIAYLSTYVTLKGASLILDNLGTFGFTISKMLWGFNFIIGALYAILLRVVFDHFKKKKIMVRNYPNNFLLQRIAGGCFDFMIAASIAGISMTVLKQYLIPTLVVTTFGGVVTILYIIFISKRIYVHHVLENIVAMYGMLTGTISTGLALLREVDPEFDTQAANNLVLGSGVGLFFGFPLMMVLGLPAIGYTTGRPVFYVYTLMALIGYFVFLQALMYMNRPGKRKT